MDDVGEEIGNEFEVLKTFWRCVNSAMEVRVPVGDLEREDGTVATTDTGKAEVLNQFFCTSVFTFEDKGPRL